MRILVTGKGGKSGSWQIRGVQLGDALGATVQALAEPGEIRAADVVVCVKRVPASVVDSCRKIGVPWVWDIVDAYPQPDGNSWSRAQAMQWLSGQIRKLSPDGVICATVKMQADVVECGYRGHVTTAYHHAWGRYSPAQAREAVRVVGYEGSPIYLGRWETVLRDECTKRGWLFQINGDMRQADIGVALREASGYPARHWKSNCKLANLHALGIPCLLSMEAGYMETAAGHEYWIQTRADVVNALDAFEPYDVREQIRSPRIDVSTVSKGVHDFLRGVVAK